MMPQKAPARCGVSQNNIHNSVKVSRSRVSTSSTPVKIHRSLHGASVAPQTTAKVMKMTKVRRNHRVDAPDPLNRPAPTSSSMDFDHFQEVHPQSEANLRRSSIPPYQEGGANLEEPFSHRSTLMELDVPSSTDYSGTPASTITSGVNEHNVRHIPQQNDSSPSSGHGLLTMRSSVPNLQQGRAYSNPDLPFQNPVLFEEWLQELLPGSPESDALRYTQGGGPMSQQYWNQSFEPNVADTILPRGVHHIHELQGSWSLFEEPSKSRTQPPIQAPELFSGEEGDAKLENMSRLSLSNWPGSDTSKPGIRSGPLTSETRQNANDVRNVGSCLRCFVMRESCDTGYPCRNCSQKEARSWKFGKQCVRPRLPQRSRYLVPEALISRLKKDYVTDFINQRGWRAQTNLFALPLEIGLGGKLDLPVREYLPLLAGNQYSSAHLIEPSPDGPRGVEVYEYDLPVVISCFDEHKAAQHIRNTLKDWFAKTMQSLNDKESKWAEHWFDVPEDSFQCEIMGLICEYFRADLNNQHDLLRTALALSFFNFIFSHSFSVPEADIPYVLAKMEISPEAQAHNLKYVCPRTINMYIKMVMRPPLTDVAQRTLKGLENLLLDTDNRSKWRRDIIFAVAFIVISHIGKTQVALIQAAHSPDPHESAAIPAFGTKEAEEQVIAIESDLVNILILYLKQFMVPSARRKHYSSGSPNKSRKTRPGDLEAEQHAEQFDFMEKVQAIKERYASTMPTKLELHSCVPDQFMGNNTHRVCWKFVHECLQV